jgi:hypothetical protein
MLRSAAVAIRSSFFIGVGFSFHTKMFASAAAGILTDAAQPMEPDGDRRVAEIFLQKAGLKVCGE